MPGMPGLGGPPPVAFTQGERAVMQALCDYSRKAALARQELGAAADRGDQNQLAAKLLLWMGNDQRVFEFLYVYCNALYTNLAVPHPLLLMVAEVHSASGPLLRRGAPSAGILLLYRMIRQMEKDGASLAVESDAADAVERKPLLTRDEYGHLFQLVRSKVATALLHAPPQQPTTPPADGKEAQPADTHAATNATTAAGASANADTAAHAATNAATAARVDHAARNTLPMWARAGLSLYHHEVAIQMSSPEDALFQPDDLVVLFGQQPGFVYRVLFEFSATPAPPAPGPKAMALQVCLQTLVIGRKTGSLLFTSDLFVTDVDNVNGLYQCDVTEAVVAQPQLQHGETRLLFDSPDYWHLEAAVAAGLNQARPSLVGELGQRVLLPWLQRLGAAGVAALRYQTPDWWLRSLYQGELALKTTTVPLGLPTTTAAAGMPATRLHCGICDRTEAPVVAVLTKQADAGSARVVCCGVDGDCELRVRHLLRQLHPPLLAQITNWLGKTQPFLPRPSDGVVRVLCDGQPHSLQIQLQLTQVLH